MSKIPDVNAAIITAETQLEMSLATLGLASRVLADTGHNELAFRLGRAAEYVDAQRSDQASRQGHVRLICAAGLLKPVAQVISDAADALSKAPATVATAGLLRVTADAYKSAYERAELIAGLAEISDGVAQLKGALA